MTPSMHTLIDEKVAIPLDKYLSHLPEDQKKAQMHIEFENPDTFKVNFAMNHIYSEARHINLEFALVDLREQLEVQIKRFYKKE